MGKEGINGERFIFQTQIGGLEDDHKKDRIKKIKTLCKKYGKADALRLLIDNFKS